MKKLTQHQNYVYNAFLSLEAIDLDDGVRAFQVIEKMKQLGYPTHPQSYSIAYERTIARTLSKLADMNYISKKRYRYTHIQYHSFYRFFLV